MQGWTRRVQPICHGHESLGHESFSWLAKQSGGRKIPNYTTIFGGLAMTGLDAYRQA
jgi:hypothetical protein